VILDSVTNRSEFDPASSTLTATSRSSDNSHADNTRPMPPRAISPVTSRPGIFGKPAVSAQSGQVLCVETGVPAESVEDAAASRSVVTVGGR